MNFYKKSLTYREFSAGWWVEDGIGGRVVVLITNYESCGGSIGVGVGL